MASTRSLSPVMVAPVVTILFTSSFLSIHHSTASPSRLQPICPASAAESALQNLHPRHTSCPHHNFFLPNTAAVFTETPFNQYLFNIHLPIVVNCAITARVNVPTNHSPFPRRSSFSSITIHHLSASSCAEIGYSSPSSHNRAPSRKLPANAAVTGRISPSTSLLSSISPHHPPAPFLSSLPSSTPCHLPIFFRDKNSQPL